MPLVALLIVPIGASAVAALLPAHARNRAAATAGLATVAMLAALAAWFPRVREGAAVVERIEWVPDLGLDLVLRLDGLSWLFCVVVLGIGALVVLYARYYLSPTDPVPRFYAFLLAFITAMLGVVLSGNVLQLALFWELTSLFSFLLIGYWHHRKDAQRGARMSLAVTATGGLCLLAGVLVLGAVAGSYDLDAILESASRVKASPLYPLALCLILAGAFTKSAQFPFQFWLPNAMAAPTPVSAYLHSATLVKLGVFLLARLWPVLSGTDLWFWLVASVGLLTLLLGAWLALFQRDLKGVLAYSTISHLGLIVLLLGLNSPLAAVAAVFHAVNHATFKASLFMAVGIIDHETGTRDIRRLSGLYRLMPITGTLALVATAAMAGVPLLNGFLSKEMFFAETLSLEGSPFAVWTLPILATLAGAGSVAYSLRFAVEVFFGPSTARDTPREPEEPPKWMRVPVEVLVLLCLVVGIFPAASVGPLLAAASRQVIGGELPAYSLKLWHGFTPELLMSTLALLAGVVLYLAVRRREMSASPLGGRVFIRLLAWLTMLSRSVRARFLSAGLQRQLLLLVLVTLLVGFSAAAGGIGTRNRPLVPLSPAFIALWAVGGVAAVASAWQAKFHRIAALMCAGTAGAICCVTFIWFSGPDLALTQLTVEVVTTLLMLLGLRWLPPREPERAIYNARVRRSATGRRTRDFIVAAAGGVAMALLSFAVMTRDFPERTSFYLEKALDEGGGTNVVNVMLVDFRGFDTFGEGIVLALVALTVYALLRRFRPAAEVMALPPQQRAVPTDLVTDLVNPRGTKDPAVGYLAVPAVLVRLMLPVSGMAAAFFFLRGHNAPGGGFVAGLILSLGLLLQYIVSGTEWVEDRVRLRPRALIGAGILFAVATATAPIAFGYPLLTSGAFDLGGLHVGSVLFFDLGVFCIVLGSTLFILVALAHQSIRAHRASEDR
ncbi:MAG: monovalent cation/H+ antiporter subunit A [Myxococcales bacterium]